MILMLKHQMSKLRIIITTHAFCLPSLPAMLAVLAVLLLAFALVPPAGANPRDGDQPPDLGDCQDLAVGEGNEVALHALGVGVQIYRWDGTSWVFVAPQAVLFAVNGHHGVVGIHFGGPTWESIDGSEVVGAVVETCTPDPTAIPWLLLSAASTEGRGIFGDLTFLQRVNTVGGIAPATPGAFPGQVARVPYSADYFFYRSDH